MILSLIIIIYIKLSFAFPLEPILISNIFVARWVLMDEAFITPFYVFFKIPDKRGPPSFVDAFKIRNDLTDKYTLAWKGQGVHLSFLKLDPLCDKYTN